MTLNEPSEPRLEAEDKHLVDLVTACWSIRTSTPILACASTGRSPRSYDPRMLSRTGAPAASITLDRATLTSLSRLPSIALRRCSARCSSIRICTRTCGCASTARSRRSSAVRQRATAGGRRERPGAETSQGLELELELRDDVIGIRNQRRVDHQAYRHLAAVAEDAHAHADVSRGRSPDEHRPHWRPGQIHRPGRPRARWLRSRSPSP